MEKEKIEMFVGRNVENFDPMDMQRIRTELEKVDDSKFVMVNSLNFTSPNMILIIALLLGWERFWLDDIGLGIVKVITAYGCGIWWLIDVISAKKRAKAYNMKKFLDTIALM